MSKSFSISYSKLKTISHSRKAQLNTFYVLAFVPLLLVAYYNINFLSPLIFGFLLLLIKRSSLWALPKATHIQRNLGLILVSGSFAAYFALFYFFPYVNVYGGAIYVLHILGLFLVFFDLSGWKEAFTPLFIAAAATLVASVNRLFDNSLSPYVVPPFTSFIGASLNTLGLRASVQYPNFISLYALRGTLYLQIVWGCVGAYGALLFSTLLVVVLFEEPGRLKTKMIWAAMGIAGVLILNVVRLLTILAIAYYYEFDVAELSVHPYLGYILFLGWLMLFLYMFSNRESIFKKSHVSRNQHN